MTSANCILDVFMEPVANHGSATVSLSGEECFVMQVTRTSDLWLSFNGRFGFLSLCKSFLPTYLVLCFCLLQCCLVHK